MIQTIEVVEWKDILCRWKWEGELNKKIKNNEFRNIQNTKSNEISSSLFFLISEFNKEINHFDQIKGLIDFINQKLGYTFLHYPNDEEITVWLKVNTLITCISFKEEWYSDGYTEYSAKIKFIDKLGNDEEWINIINELLDNATFDEKELETTKLWEEWGDYYSKMKWA